MKRRDDRQSEHGFSLAELLVACVIIAFVIAGLLVMLQTGAQSYLVGSNQVEAQQTARTTIAQMVQEVRNAGYCPTCAGTPPFTALASPTGTGFTVQNDWDGDGAITTTGTVTDANGKVRGEQIVYAYSSGTLTRQEAGVDASAVTLATGINDLTFTYQDGTGATTATAADIRTIVGAWRSSWP